MKNTIIFSLAFVLFAGAAVCLAQGWQHTYGGSSRDWGNSVAQTADGGYIVAGETASFGAGYGDVYLVKTDALGDTIWTRTYGGSGYDYGYSVAQTTDGGYIVAGYSSGNVYLVKTDGMGNTVWTRTYGGSYDDKGYSVAQTTDGGYIVAGLTASFNAGYEDVYLVKTDGVGDTIWTRTYGGSGNNDRGYSVAQTTDGGYIVAGYTYSFGAGSTDVYLVKTDAAGNELWTRTYGTSYDDWSRSVAQTADGGYIVAGYTHVFGAARADVYLVKTDSLGFTAINEPSAQKPQSLSLSVYSNSFNSSVKITVGQTFLSVQNGQTGMSDLPVTIEIYDLRGHIVGANGVRPMDEGRMPYAPTNRTFIWHPDETITSGIYLVRARTNKTTVTKRIVYIR